MVALQHQRTGCTFVAVESPAGDALDFYAIVDCDTVECNRQLAPQERDVVNVPFAWWSGCHVRRL